MEIKIMEKITKALQQQQKIALVTLTRSEGSTPGKEGSLMCVEADGKILGTIGGGKIEKTVMDQALHCIEENTSKHFKYELSDSAELGMICGGLIEGYIKVFGPSRKLLIAGGGHVAFELYQLACLLKYEVVIFEDREEFGNKERFPKAAEIIVGNVAERLSQYPIDDNSCVMVVTRGHQQDEEALKAVIHSPAAYIGMIGSWSKAKKTLEKLLEEGYEEEQLKKVYSPSGLGIGGTRPEDIALSIMAEIQKITHQGQLIHLKDTKRKEQEQA